MKEQINMEIDPNDIEIIHRVGGPNDTMPRSILVKFLSDKTKEKGMRKKKEAKNIKITEGLAHGTKRTFDEVSKNLRYLGVDSVWTIDGKIKYRLLNNPHTFEIRSYTDNS